MSPEFWAIVGVGVGGTLAIIWAVGACSASLERKIDRLIEEVRYPNLEARKRDLLGAEAYNSMIEML